MSIKLSDSIRVGQQKPLEDKYFNELSPYTSTSQVNTLLPKAVRHIGLTVNINGEEYWYKDGIEDANLVLKVPNIDTSNLVPYTGATQDVNIASNYFKTSKGFEYRNGFDYFNVIKDVGGAELKFYSSNSLDSLVLTINPQIGLYFLHTEKNSDNNNLFSVTKLNVYSKKGFVTDEGYQIINGTANQALRADGGVFDLNTKADLVGGKVPASQLPAYVDDVLEFANLSSFPATGESGKIYIALDTNLTYRWGGSSYVVMSSSLALGETSSTAYRGDRGKIAYDHSQTTGNPHNTTATDVDALKRDGSNANSVVNIGAYYFESSQGFKKTGGTPTQYLMADGSTSTLPTDLIRGVGTAGRIAKYLATGVIVDSVIYDNGVSVGIGTTVLGARLDVRAQGALSTDIVFRVRNSADTQNFLVVTGAGEVYNRGAKGNEFNTFFGEYSGINSTGGSNNAFGRSALASNTTGHANSAFGNNVLQDNTTGDCNNAFGGVALGSNITGNGNNAFGYNALESNTEGNDNIAIGSVALGSNTTGNDNTAVGSNALQDNTTGNQNVALGYDALLSNTTGNQNVSLGVEAGKRLNDGDNSYNKISSNSIYLGYDTRAKANNETNQIVIGHSARGNGSNTATIGNDSTTNVYLKGITNSNGFKTPTGTPNQALTANGGVFDLNTKADLVDGKVPSSQLPSFVNETKKATITVELISQLTTNFYAPNALRINSTALISGSGTLTLKVNDVAYTLGNLIPQGAKITAETTSSSVYNLISIYE